MTLLRVLSMHRHSFDRVVHGFNIAPAFREHLKDEDIHADAWFASENSLRGAVAGVWAAFRLIWRYRGSSFVVWCHHPDSNRWLQFALALSRANFLLVERSIPSSKLAFVNSRLTIPLKRFAACRAKTVVVNGHSQVSHYAALFALRPSLVRAVPNTRPIAVFARQVAEFIRARPALRKRLGLKPEARILTSVGRLSSEKGYRVLVAAMSTVLQKCPDTQLVLVGEGDQRPSLEAAARQIGSASIHFVGHQNEIAPWLAAADVFVLPSFLEGLSGALIEAMAAKLPCVASDIPSNQELVRDKLTGRCFPVGDANALAALLIELLSDLQSASKLGQAGFELVSREYDEVIERNAWSDILDRQDDL